MELHRRQRRQRADRQGVLEFGGAGQSMSKHSGQDSGVVEGVVRAGLGDVPVAGQGGEAEAVEVEVEQGGEFEGAQDRRDGQLGVAAASFGG